MDPILELFDFTSKQPHTECQPTPCFRDADGVLGRIKEASAAGDLSSLATELSHSSRASDIIEHLGGAVWLAIENRHYETVEYLLQHGAPTTATALKAATSMKDTKMLDLLLRNGYDIDMTIGPATPSAMA